jgi:hypothetical protein
VDRYTGDASNTPAATGCGDQNVTITTALYWTDDGTIVAAGLDGSSPQAIVTGQTNPTWLAVGP